METLICRFEKLENIKSEVLDNEIMFLADTLEMLRITDEISNDAFLDAGMIQGGLSIISNLLSQGLNPEDVRNQINRLKQKSIALSKTYPELDKLIEERR
ncbi:MAG: hypothetical protein CND89_02805 [Marine Group II euryarchaeote MED-G38]|nr:hypothetical protein [Euryarchaeota archaeon]OUV26094.1 MAG: hypothetical protein CBC57_03185 [Euryarchaeota archaeon TMED97]PDH22993.1 MAG: hypothetical protein CND89_02805 [Marine Group II euryarchaeote MED-G38]|tara:strand:- start:44293 stop:44592 length:300 start_codon:yes stop_codon:yes gene_type:complete